MNRKERSKSKEIKITALPSSPPDPRLAKIILPILLEGFGLQKRQSDSEHHAGCEYFLLPAKSQG
ncbi:MAG: hypothetical protein AB2805_03915 [Candidatus Thiodiazotropha sp.]